MRLHTLALALALMPIGALFAGCGGGNSSGSTRSVFAGTWSGPYTGTVNGVMVQPGTLTATIHNDGSIQGSAVPDPVPGEPALTPAPVSGNIANNGMVTADFGHVNPPYTLRGTASKTANGHLTGALAQTYQGANVGTLTIDLIPQP